MTVLPVSTMLYFGGEVHKPCEPQSMQRMRSSQIIDSCAPCQAFIVFTNLRIIPI